LITVVDLPDPSLSFDDVICVTDMVTVSFDNDLNGADYTILISGDPTSSGGLPNQETYQWDMPGTYTIQSVVTVGTCEIMSEEYTITVDPTLEAPVISCDPSTTGIDISWDPVANATMYIVTIDSDVQPAQSGTTYEITGLDPETSVVITVEAISDNSCANSSATENCMTSPCADIMIEITGNDPDCVTNLPLETQLDFILTGSAGGGTGTWSGDFITADGVFSYEQSGVGSHEVTYTHEEAGCTYPMTATVDVFDPPVLTIEPINLTCFDSDDGSIAFTAAGGDGVYEITVENTQTNLTWYNESEVLCDAPDCFDLSVSPSTNSLYCVDIELVGGCVVTNCLAVESQFISILNVSNIFSPNGDGSNDNMVIQTNNPDMIANYVRIFDRWGNMVFNLETPWSPYADMNYPGWDGTYKGAGLNPGVYVYVMEFIEEPGATPEVRVGDVTIVK